jgi:restriction system protein
LIGKTEGQQMSSTREDVPTYDKLVYPTIQALIGLGGSGSNEEILDKVLQLGHYSGDIEEVLNSRGTMSLIAYRLAWARTYLKKVGGLENSQRGIWTLTSIGKSMTEEVCKTIPNTVKKAYSELKRSQKSVIDDNEGIELADNDDVHWKEQLLSLLKKIDPSAFERLSKRVLRESGFTKVEVTGKPSDGGIDGIGILRMNLVSFTVLFQCKRYQDSVGSAAVRDFRGAMQGRCDKGLILTTGTFTSEAKKEATRDGAPTIDLIDGDEFCDLLKQLRLGVTVEQIERVTIDGTWFDLV